MEVLSCSERLVQYEDVLVNDWRAGNWPRLMDALGGLRSIATLHVGVAWLFVAFVIMHVYLTTTGHTPLAHIKAMIVGHESKEAEHEAT